MAGSPATSGVDQKARAIARLVPLRLNSQETVSYIHEVLCVPQPVHVVPSLEYLCKKSLVMTMLRLTRHGALLISPGNVYVPRRDAYTVLYDHLLRRLTLSSLADKILSVPTMMEFAHVRRGHVSYLPKSRIEDTMTLFGVVLPHLRFSSGFADIPRIKVYSPPDLFCALFMQICVTEGKLHILRCDATSDISSMAGKIHGRDKQSCLVMNFKPLRPFRLAINTPSLKVSMTTRYNIQVLIDPRNLMSTFAIPDQVLDRIGKPERALLETARRARHDGIRNIGAYGCVVPVDALRDQGFTILGTSSGDRIAHNVSLTSRG